MKKSVALLIIVYLLIVVSSAANAIGIAEFTSGNFTAKKLGDGTVTITKWIGDEAKLEIPASLEGYPVSSIGKNAFSNNHELKRIVIPESIKSIEEQAFWFCDNLNTVILPETIEIIGNSAFRSCKSLTDIKLPTSITQIGDNPFRGCDALKVLRVEPEHPYLAVIDGVLFSKPDRRLVCYLPSNENKEYIVPEGILVIGNGALSACELKSVVISNTVTEIEEDAFSANPQLSNISLPDSLKRIGFNAFNGCLSLTMVTLPSHLEILEGNAFWSCSSLHEINIPNTVNIINGNPFVNCKSLEQYDINPENTHYSILNGALVSVIDNKLINCSKVIAGEKYSVSEGIKYIGDFAFSSCTDLKTLSLPEGLLSIGSHAFTGCKNLTSIHLPSSIIKIESSAFSDCEQLTVMVERDTYVAAFCRDNGINYSYPDANDWLLGELPLNDEPESITAEMVTSDLIAGYSARSGLIAENNDNWDSLSTENQAKLHSQYVKAELDYLDKYRNHEFEDESIKNAFDLYIKGLDTQYEAATEYQGKDDITYAQLWNEGYNYRCHGLYVLSQKYPLKTDDPEVNQFLGEMIIVGQMIDMSLTVNTDLIQQLSNAISGAELLKETSRVGSIELINHAPFSIAELFISINTLDEADNIIEEETLKINDFISGKAIHTHDLTITKPYNKVGCSGYYVINVGDQTTQYDFEIYRN